MKRRHWHRARDALACVALAACTPAASPLPALEPTVLPAADELLQRLMETGRPGGLSDPALSERLLGLRWVATHTPGGERTLSARSGTPWLRYPELPLQAVLTFTPERTTLRMLLTTTRLCLSVEQVIRRLEGRGRWFEAQASYQPGTEIGWQVEPEKPGGTSWRFTIEGSGRSPAACVSALDASQPSTGAGS